MDVTSDLGVDAAPDTPSTPAAPSTPSPLIPTASPDRAVVAPSDPRYDEARRAWNLAVDQRPAAVVRPADVDGLASVVADAATTGRRLALQATGHGAATLVSLDDVVLVRTDALQGVDVDPGTRRARVLAGTRVGALVDAAAAHDLAFLAGSTPGVGAVGYTLGGGLGWLGRQHGFACNTVTGAEVITADGHRRWVDHDHEPELFWAIRGGGGSFAAVARLEVALLPVTGVQAGLLSWPLAQAAPVLRAWRDWTDDVPDAITSVARLLRYPPLPELPPHLRGRSMVTIELASLRPEDETDRWLRPLRALRPELDTVGAMGLPELGLLHGDPQHPVAASTDHRLLRQLPDAAIDTLLTEAGPDVASPLLAVDLRHLDGALRRSAPGHGALDRLDARYALFGVGLPVDPSLVAPVPAALTALRDALAPWAADTGYLNLADRPVDPARLFPPATYARLRAVRAVHDPSERFVANHHIPLPVR